MLHDKSSLTGVPQYAVYLLHRLYDENMSLENLMSLAAYLITETGTQDPKVGGPVNMATVTEPDGSRIVLSEEIEDILKRNEETSRKLKEFFFPKQGD